ncbi:Choloylglycine hydrolase [Aliarcobacter thereius]|uniref:Choloylglycine hydrolase n=2 Tax=Aliarcobacter thereius TaxID=544718 RepID=A0A1C0B652_9BACT|nr:linear amide C-N hydrolase [Aliarcobacter thereius]OCL86328.1 Choloylglycine hydrolase [Aliarcobacter thereius]OCL98651.1 Choloylglycine hydrolase [Aliarcobacter thereius]TLS71490.1 linear amide C-N hydrolase [Aliarcobacter thereius]TLT06914.1 linear amide C-N hydrolase [Aliarcobacter thereius]
MNRAIKRIFLLIVFFLTTSLSFACTRVVYHGENEIMTARSMDWKSDVGTNLWIFPNNIKRDGKAGIKSIKWTSKYGSVVATGYDISTTDGVNEKGLMANLLWLVESEYPKVEKSNKATLSISLWAQYILDNFATVEEAVKALKKEPFVVVTDQVPGEKRLATLHLSISDKKGDSAIIEYIDGKQVIHHNIKYQVMTNSPIFDKQLALNTYWQQIGGTTMLPGTNRASDRFARASFYINAIPKNANKQHTLASVFSVIRNVSVPFGLNTEEEPNISSTRWRTVFDHKRGLYFFESAVSPNIFWVDIKAIDFRKTDIKKLYLGENQENIYSGDVSSSFKKEKAFEFLGVK